MARFDDGVYLEWSKFGGEECDQRAQLDQQLGALTRLRA